MLETAHTDTQKHTFAQTIRHTGISAHTINHTGDILIFNQIEWNESVKGCRPIRILYHSAVALDAIYQKEKNILYIQPIFAE